MKVKKSVGAPSPIQAEIVKATDEAADMFDRLPTIPLPRPNIGPPDEHGGYLNENGNDPDDTGPEPDPFDDETF